MKPLTEEQMWDIIDGIATPEIRAEHDILIKNDADYKASFDTLMNLQKQLMQLDFEQPSMRFTQNVMDKVSPSVNMVAKKEQASYIFMFIITVLFLSTIFIVSGATGSANQTTLPFDLSFIEKIKTGLSNPLIMPVFLIINTGLLFMALDKWILKTYLKNNNTNYTN